MTQAPDNTGSELPDLEPDHHPSQVRSGPPRAFQVLGWLMIIGFGVAAFLILSPMGESEPTEKVLSIAEPEPVTPSVEIKAESPDSAHLARIPELEKRLMMLSQRLQAQAEEIAENRQSLETLDSTLSQAASSAATGIEAQISRLESTVTGQTSALNNRVTAIELAHSRKAKKKKRTVQAPPLPFTLLSVDYWDNKPYAVLSYKGALHHLSPGETLHQWTLDSLTSNEATFRYTTGKKRKLKLEGKT